MYFFNIKFFAVTIILFAFIGITFVSAQATPSDNSRQIVLPELCILEDNGIDLFISNSVQNDDSFEVSGLIANDSDILLSNMDIIAHIEKVSIAGVSDYDAASDTIDRLVVAESLFSHGKSAVPFSFKYSIPENIHPGTYRVKLFLVSSGQFTLSGGEYLSGNSSAHTFFTINNESIQSVSYIDTNSVTINGRGLIANKMRPVLGGGKVDVFLNIENNHDENRPVKLKWDVYSSEVIHPRNLVESRTDDLTLVSDKSLTASFSIDSVQDPLYHIVVALIDGDKNSIYSFRVLNANRDYDRFSLLGLSSFPIKEGERNAVTACITSSALRTINNTESGQSINISLVRKDGSRLVDLGSVQRSSSVLAFTRKLLPTRDIPSFITLKVELVSDSGEVLSVATADYSCDLIDCGSFLKRFSTSTYLWITVLAIVGVIVTVAFKRRRRIQLNQINEN